MRQITSGTIHVSDIALFIFILILILLFTLTGNCETCGFDYDYIRGV